MANLVRNYSLELPIYDVDTPALSHIGKNIISKIPNETFIRKVRFRSIGSLSLKEALNSADYIFDDIANKCGARVIEHNWGLLKTKHQVNQYYMPAGLETKHPKILPKKHLLVAEVHKLEEVSKVGFEEIEKIDNVLVNMFASADNNKIWTDAHTNQFVIGKSILDDVQRSLWLVDIEPLFD